MPTKIVKTHVQTHMANARTNAKALYTFIEHMKLHIKLWLMALQIVEAPPTMGLRV